MFLRSLRSKDSSGHNQKLSIDRDGSRHNAARARDQRRFRQRVPNYRQIGLQEVAGCGHFLLGPEVSLVRPVVTKMLVSPNSVLANRAASPAESVKFMLSRCANQDCGRPFLRLREGKLFLVETARKVRPGESVAPPFVRARKQQRLVEHYWLCDCCAEQWTLAYGQDGGIVLVPLKRPVASMESESSAAQSGAA